MNLLRPSWKSPLRRTLLRWAHHPLQRKAEWQFKATFWNWRNRFLSIQHWISSHGFKYRFGFNTRRESASALRDLLANIYKSVLAAVIIVIALEGIEYLLLQHLHTIIDFLPLSTDITKLAAAIKSSLSWDTSTYAGAVGSLAEISGTFLGLYFTAVSIVASTVYVRVQGDVRSLLMRDKVGNQYIFLVALLGAISILHLGIFSFGRQPGIFNVIFILILGISSIFSFVVLSFRTFHFFDPTQLVSYLISDIIKWVGRATIGGYKWQLPAFQSHYQKKADEAIDTYRNIVYLANKEEHLQSQALVGLASRAFYLMQIYGREKGKIPSDSMWFRRVPKHLNWLVTSDSQTIMALNTGTTLQPELVPDLMWFETEIEDIALYCLEGLFARKDLLSAYTFTNSAVSTFGTLASSYAVDEALHLFRTLSPVLRSEISKIDVTKDESEAEVSRLKLALGLTDVYGLGFINILLKLSERLGALTPDSLGDLVAKVVWDDSRSLYRTALPRKVIEQMEYLRNCFLFEKEVEGRIVSPLWYRKQSVAISFARYIASVVEALVDELENVFIKQVAFLISEKKYIFAAQLIERGLEACNKFSYHFSTARKCLEGLEELRSAKDMPWPTVKWDALEIRIDGVREKLIEGLGQVAEPLSKLNQNTNLPDYFGHAYTVIADECYRAIANGKEEVFRKLFSPFFMASIAAHHKLREQNTFDISTQIGLSSQPLADLFEISGYAIVFQELDGKQFWSFVNPIWDNYFNGLQNVEAAAKYMSMTIAFKDSSFMTYPRDMIRFNWRQDFENRMRERGLVENIFARQPMFDGRERAMHPNPLIRALMRGMLMTDKVRDVFIAKYLVERFGADNLELGRRTKEFLYSLELESRRGNAEETDD